MSLCTSQPLRGAKVIPRRLRGAAPKRSSPPVNNFWNSYKGRGEVLPKTDCFQRKDVRTRSNPTAKLLTTASDEPDALATNQLR